mgnify:CR=1 FL=1
MIAYLKSIIFINVNTHTELKDFAQIVHLYFIDGVFDKTDVETWMGEVGGELVQITKKKIVFSFFDTYFPTRMTVYQSGKVRVENDLDSFP